MPEHLIESINDTARMARTMLSLLLVAALVVVLMLSFSSDENLFRDDPVELPQIGIGISIKQSYIVAPLIFLYLHLQVLYLLSVLARKMWAFREELEGVTLQYEEVARQRYFDRLSAFVFIQLFQDRHVPLFSWFLLWLGVVVIPLVLLFFMDLSFVRYQSDKITIGHHIVFIIDFVFVMWSVWTVWPRTDEPREPRAVMFRMISRVIHAIPSRNMRISVVVAIHLIVFFVLYKFVGTTMEHPVIPVSMFFVGAIILGILIFVVKIRLGRVACDELGKSRVASGMITLTAVVSVFMMIFLFHSVKPPHFDTETVKRDRECIWKDDGKENDNMTEEDASCSNYIDRFLCKWLDFCRYLDLRYKWLASTQVVDLAGLVTYEFGDETAKYSHRWSVNNLHMFERSFRFAVFHDATLHGADFRKAKLDGADFTLAKLHSAKFPEAQLRNTKFYRSESKNAVFRESKSQGADFSYSALQGASFELAQLQGSNFKDAKLTGAFFIKARLQGANFEDARLQVTDFEGAELQGADLKNAELNGTVLREAKLQGANFSGVQLEGVDLGRAQLQGSFYEKEFVSWKLAWMPNVSFTFCCAEQYNEMIQKILEKNSGVKLPWKKEEKKEEKEEEERMFIWDKVNEQCTEKENKSISLEDHLCDYLMRTDRTKLNCEQIFEKSDLTICYENLTEPYPYFSDDKRDNWTRELAVLMSKLACKDSYTAERIFSRWRRINILSNSPEILSDKLRKVGRNILDCKREKGNRTCPGLNTIPDGRWSRLWTDFDDDLPESFCTTPGLLQFF